MWEEATSILSSGGIKKTEVSIFTPSSSYTIDEKKSMVTRTVKWQAEKKEAWCGCDSFEQRQICKEVLAVVRYAGDVDLFVQHFQKTAKLFRSIIKPTSSPPRFIVGLPVRATVMSYIAMTSPRYDNSSGIYCKYSSGI